MKQINNSLVLTEVILAVLLIAGVLIQTPKASGLGGTIGGGGDGLGGGYRTRRGLERQISWTTWVMVVAFLSCAVANVWGTPHLVQAGPPPRGGGWRCARS